MEYPSRLDAVEANAQQKIFDRKVLRHSLASVFYLGFSYGSCGGQVLRVRYASRPGRLTRAAHNHPFYVGTSRTGN